MTNTSVDTLNVLARRGMGHLFIRQIFTTAVTLAGGAVLARALSPAEFGTYAIATFIVNIFMVFGDFGLGAAFIQNAKTPSHKDLQIAFTIQFCLITTVVSLTWMLSPWIVAFYPSIGASGSWLARALSLLLYIPIFRSISAVQLERTLNYRPIAWAEGAGITLYQIVAVVCAMNAMGVWSLVIATFIAGLASFTVMYHAAPWPIRLRFDWAEIRRVVKSGLSFQSAAVVDVISQWATPAIVGTLIGPNAVGYLGLALANAKRPLLLAESVMRVSYPHFSRLQGEVKRLHDTITDYLLGFLWLMVMWTGFLWISGSPLVAIVYSSKWLPAVPAMVIFALALPLDIIIWTMGLCYRAANRNWDTLKIFSMRTALNLALAILLVPRLGFTGIAWAYLVANMACTVLLLTGFASGFFTRVFRTAWWVVPAAVFGCIGGRVVAGALLPAGNPAPIPQFFAGAVPFLTIYVVASLILVPKQYRDRLSDALRGLRLSGYIDRAIFSLRVRARRVYNAVPRAEGRCEPIAEQFTPSASEVRGQ